MVATLGKPSRHSTANRSPTRFDHQKIQGASPWRPIFSRCTPSARYRIYKLSKCATRRNHRSITAGQRRFEVYLAHLQPHTRMEWENRLAIDLQSVQAYNHGISVHRQQEAARLNNI